MKTLLLTFFLFIAFQSNINSQTIKKTAMTEMDKDGNSAFAYLTGTDKVSGYELKVCAYPKPTPTAVKNFKNGRSAPILQMYVTEKAKYVGGVLENEKGKTTIIKNITLIEDGDTLIFTVVGKDFSMSFNLVTGLILKEESNTTVLYTEGVGSWKINKKK